MSKRASTLKTTTTTFGKYLTSTFTDVYSFLAADYACNEVETSEEYASQVSNHYIGTQLLNRRSKKYYPHNERCLALKPDGGRCNQPRYLKPEGHKIDIKNKNGTVSKRVVDTSFCYLHNRTSPDSKYTGDGTEHKPPVEFVTPNGKNGKKKSKKKGKRGRKAGKGNESDDDSGNDSGNDSDDNNSENDDSDYDSDEESDTEEAFPKITPVKILNGKKSIKIMLGNADSPKPSIWGYSQETNEWLNIGYVVDGSLKNPDGEKDLSLKSLKKKKILYLHSDLKEANLV